MTRPALAFSLTLTLALTLSAADPCVSGIPVGKRPGPYSFLVATGPQRGQQTCYICEQHEGGKPAAVVFARSLSDPLGKLQVGDSAVALQLAQYVVVDGVHGGRRLCGQSPLRSIRNPSPWTCE